MINKSKRKQEIETKIVKRPSTNKSGSKTTKSIKKVQNDDNDKRSKTTKTDNKRRTKTKTKKQYSDDELANTIVDNNDADAVDIDDNNNEENDNNDKPAKAFGQRSRERLKAKIVEWLDFDDKIKLLSARAKKYRDAKKEHEKNIMKMIVDFGIEKERLEIKDENQNIRGRVYRYKSMTKCAIKEDIIKKALMEVFKNERRVDELIKKIDSNRQIKENYYLKRTKGGANGD